MNKIVYAVLAAAILTACSDEPAVNSEIPKSSETSDGIVYPNSPAFKSSQSRSGSTFETDWENFQVVNIPNNAAVPTPWSDYTSAPGLESRKDVKKEDGWTMVMHTLSEEGQIYGNPKYIVLYNERTGHLRTFYYYEGHNTEHNNDFWYVTFSNPNQAITNTTYPVTAASDYRDNSNYAFTSSMNNGLNSLLCIGWNMLDIPLAYDPNLSGDLTMYIGFYSNTTFDVKLSSESVGKAEGTLITDVTKNPFNSLENAILNASGAAAKTFLGKFAPITDLGLTDMIAGGFKSLIKKPLNLIFNKLLGAFVKNETTVQTINLTYQEKGQITGTMSALMRSDALDMNLPIGENKTNVKLGAWNLKEVPTIYMHPVGVLYKRYYGDMTDENDYLFCASGNYKTDIVFNPQLVPHIKNYRIKCTPVLMEPKGFNMAFLPEYPGDMTDCGSLGSNTDNPLRTQYDYDKDFVARTDQPGNTDGGYVTIFDNKVKESATIWNIWAKFGKPDQNSYRYDSPVWKYIYAPENIDLIRGKKFCVNTRYYYLKVTLYAEMEFEGKTYNTMETRTYKPRFEWDPYYLQRYGGMTMSALQDYCEIDQVLRAIDVNELPKK